MKTALLLPLMVFAVSSLHAQTQTSRTLVQFGLLLTKGDDTGWDQMEPGVTLNVLNYFDPSSPDGWYYGILGSAFARSSGGIILADTRLVTLGWRGDLGRLVGSPGPFQLDAGLAPTIGARIRGSSILGSAYTGIGLTLGLGFSVFEGQDLGLSWEPVFPLTSWGRGEARATNRGYSDFVISWTVKSFFEKRDLPWSGRQP